MGKNYWMMVASLEDFEITKQHGFTVYGVRGKYRRRAQRMQPEDRILFYVKGLRKWTATATITSQFFEDRTPIWNVDGRSEVYPFRVKTKPEIVLSEEDYIDALMLAPRLEYVKRWAPEDWPLAFFESLHLLPQKDFRLIEAEMNKFVTPRRNGGRRQHQDGAHNGTNRIQGWEQDRRRTGNTNNDWRNGPPMQTPPQNAPQTPVTEPIDEHEAVAPANADPETAPHTLVDGFEGAAPDMASDRPADEHENGQPVGEQTWESSGQMPADDRTSSQVPGDSGGPEADQGSVVDDHPATDDSSTDSSST